MIENCGVKSLLMKDDRIDILEKLGFDEEVLGSLWK